MYRGLFRKESIDARRTSFYGRVQLALPISHVAWSTLAVCAGSLIIAFLTLSTYTRRERVSGTLKPEGGMISVTSRTTGVVSRIPVSEGAHVDIGDILLEVSGERSSSIKGDTAEAIARELDLERQGIENDIEDIDKLSQKQAEDLKMQESMLSEQIKRINAQEAIASEQVRHVTELFARITPLASKGYISTFDVHQQKINKLNAESQVKELQRKYFDLIQQRDSISIQLEQLPLTATAKINDLRRKLTQNQRSVAQNELERSAIVRASQPGTVTSIIVNRGQVVTAGDGLLEILPDGSPLHAELLVPSRAIGFVRRGITVGIRYQAYPYQKFGVQRGIVTDISRAPLTRRELSALLGGHTSEEPMFRVLVEPGTQDISVYGEKKRLRAGMALDADMFLDQRRLIEWILEPLYAARRRTEVLK